jgi:uncharacterized protein YjbJ (UPF0337 family)
MDKDRVEGVSKKLEGSLKDITGQAIGDSKLESEGKLQHAMGTVQNIAGGISDGARSVYDDAPESLKLNIQKTVDLIRANPAIASIAVATVGGLATWYAASLRKS